jgi:hypothetical protein
MTNVQILSQGKLIAFLVKENDVTRPALAKDTVTLYQPLLHRFGSFRVYRALGDSVPLSNVSLLYTCKNSRTHGTGRSTTLAES